MADDREVLWPVLVVDDEYRDIEGLERVLDVVGSRAHVSGRYSVPWRIRHSAAHPEEATRVMLEAIDKDYRFSAIVCDNHMQGEDYEAIRGEDFLRVLRGEVGFALTKRRADAGINIYQFHSFRELFDYFSPVDGEVKDFLESSFEGEIGNYQGLVEYFFGANSPNLPVIMLCGNPSEVYTEGLENVAMIQKIGGCERVVLEELADVLPSEFLARTIEEDHILSSNVSPNQSTFKPSIRDKIKAQRKKFLALRAKRQLSP